MNAPRSIYMMLAGSAALLALSTAVAAQGARPNARITVLVGAMSATMHGDSVPGPTHKSGTVAGVAFDWPHTGRLSFLPGIEFGAAGRTFTLAARYEQGLLNVVKDNDAKSRALGVTLGVNW